MLKQFMFYAYDDSAKILSWLMGYKLYDSNHGPAAAGPDKEKIIAALSTNHINFIVSEFGEITAKKTFKDNKYDCLISLHNHKFPLRSSAKKLLILWGSKKQGQNSSFQIGFWPCFILC